MSLPRLAQSLRLSSGPNLGRGILPVNFRLKRLFWCLLWHVDMLLDRSGSHKVCFPVLGSVFLLNIIVLNTIIFLLLNIKSSSFSPLTSSSSTSSSSPSSSALTSSSSSSSLSSSLSSSNHPHHHHHQHYHLSYTILWLSPHCSGSLAVFFVATFATASLRFAQTYSVYKCETALLHEWRNKDRLAST